MLGFWSEPAPPQNQLGFTKESLTTRPNLSLGFWSEPSPPQNQLDATKESLTTHPNLLLGFWSELASPKDQLGATKESLTTHPNLLLGFWSEPSPPQNHIDATKDRKSNNVFIFYVKMMMVNYLQSFSAFICMFLALSEGLIHVLLGKILVNDTSIV